MIPSWVTIGAVVILVAAPLSRISSRERRWFNDLLRPRWLTFEKAIPLIWITIFICGAASANALWTAQPGTQMTWGLMALYLALEVVTLAYTPVMCKRRSLGTGTVLGAAGLILGIVLFSLVLQHSTLASGLLIPFLLWSPIGTYVTWVMLRLNPSEA